MVHIVHHDIKMQVKALACKEVIYECVPEDLPSSKIIKRSLVK